MLFYPNASGVLPFMYSLSTCWNSGRHTCGREMLREIRSLGFEYAELSHGIRISLLPGILEAVDAGEIKISTLHNFCPLPMGINWPAPNLFKFSAEDRRERDSALKHTLKTIETAHRVGAKLIVLHSGSADLKSGSLFSRKVEYQEKLEELVLAGKKDSDKYRKLVEDLEIRREKYKGEPMQRSLDMIRKLAGAALAILAAWLLWQGISAVSMIVSRGSPLDDALLQPPTSLWRILAAGLALLGGLLAALNVKGGAWLGMTGAVLFAALPGAMAALGTDSSLWMDEVYSGGAMIVLAGLLAFVKRS